MGIVDVWQSYNARKGEGGTDRYIRVAWLSARERKLASIPPSLPSSLTSTLPSKFDMSGELLSTATFPPSPSIAQSRDMDHDDGLTAHKLSFNPAKGKVLQNRLRDSSTACAWQITHRPSSEENIFGHGCYVINCALPKMPSPLDLILSAIVWLH